MTIESKTIYKVQWTSPNKIEGLVGATEDEGGLVPVAPTLANLGKFITANNITQLIQASSITEALAIASVAVPNRAVSSIVTNGTVIVGVN